MRCFRIKDLAYRPFLLCLAERHFRPGTLPLPSPNPNHCPAQRHLIGPQITVLCNLPVRRVRDSHLPLAQAHCRYLFTLRQFRSQISTYFCTTQIPQVVRTKPNHNPPTTDPITLIPQDKSFHFKTKLAIHTNTALAMRIAPLQYALDHPRPI